MNLTGTVTTAGAELITALKDAEQYCLRISRIVCGSGTTATSATTMAAENYVAGNARQITVDGKSAISFTAYSHTNFASFTLKEVGVYVYDTSGKEILYKLYTLSSGVVMAPTSPKVVAFTLLDIKGDFSGVVLMTGQQSSVIMADEDGVISPAMLPIITSSKDIEAGVTPLKSGWFYFQYE